MIKNKFRNIDVKELGLGPFLASFSLLRGYTKFLPIVYQILLLLVIILDNLLIFLMKTNPRIIYPIGYIFSAWSAYVVLNMFFLPTRKTSQQSNNPEFI